MKTGRGHNKSRLHGIRKACARRSKSGPTWPARAHRARSPWQRVSLSPNAYFRDCPTGFCRHSRVATPIAQSPSRLANENPARRWTVGSAGRAFPSHGRGRRFNPYSAHQKAPTKTRHGIQFNEKGQNDKLKNAAIQNRAGKFRNHCAQGSVRCKARAANDAL